MIIVYAAVAGQSVVKLYAAAMLPGFFLAFLYFLYIIGWALIDPKVAPKLPEEQLKVEVPPWLTQTVQRLGPHAIVALLKALVSPSARRSMPAAPRTGQLVGSLIAGLGAGLLVITTLATLWWYVMIHLAQSGTMEVDLQPPASVQAAAEPSSALAEPPSQDGASSASSGGLQEPPAEEGAASGTPAASGSDKPASSTGGAEPAGGVQELSTPGASQVPAYEPPKLFVPSFAAACVICALGLAWYYRRMDAERLEIQRRLYSSVMPLGILTALVLVVILFGITTATESAAVGAAGAFLLAWQSGQLTWAKTREAVYLTGKTTAMVCWLFVGSSLFSAVFALHGGQELIEHWILSLNLSSMQFLLLSQALIFILGWPLEWTEIIVIFVPIFLPLLTHFQIDPILFATLVAVNLQAAFLSPPVAMSAFYLKGVSPPHVTLNQIFAGMMPYMLIVIVCMVLMYVFPGMTLWLPNFLYGSAG
jgi:TRAP-type mannitol/chloroaromatic compound transport system permease large subunit